MNMLKDMAEAEIAIFDTETTGLGYESGDKIVEIAAIRIKGGKRIGQFHSLVNPNRPISPEAQKVNNITPDMLKDAPGIHLVMPNFLEFVSGACLCSYNASFDMGFLNSELKSLGQKQIDTPAIDLLKMSRKLLPGLERYPLWFVAQKLGIAGGQEHRAMADVELTLNVFRALSQVLKLKKIDDFDKVVSLFGYGSSLLKEMLNQKITQIQQAIDSRGMISIEYFSGVNAEVSSRKVIPKNIRQDRDSSYLIGYCCLRQEERIFRVDGILHIEIV